MLTILGSGSLLLLFVLHSSGAMYLGQNWGHVLGAERMEQPRCVEIPQNFSLCYGIQYSMMRIPNLLEHETLSEAIQQSDAWNSLLRLHCHADTKLFLCSVFAPVCVPEMDKPIYPCQSLCQAVKQGCEDRMLQYGFNWPEMLDCSRYPKDNDMCIRRPEGDEPQSHAGLPRMFSSNNNQTRVELTSESSETKISTTTQVTQTTTSQFDSTTTTTSHPNVGPMSSQTNTPIQNNSLLTSTTIRIANNNKVANNSVPNLDTRRERDCDACAQVPTYENILDNFCRSNTVFKAKIRSHNSTHVQIQRIQRVFKPQTRRPAQTQQNGRFIQYSSRDELDCQCASNGKSRMSGNYLVMSNNNVATDQTINARLILPWQQDKVFKSAIRKFRKMNCAALGREIRESVLRQQNRRQPLQF